MIAARLSVRQSAVVARQFHVTASSHPMEWRSCLIRPLLAAFHHTPRDFLRSPAPPHQRYFSSITKNTEQNLDQDINKPIRILVGSQGGTAQIFAMQLADAMDETFDGKRSVETLALNEASSVEDTLDPNAINVILTSVAGVGEPPDNARAFYEWLMSDDAFSHDDWNSIQYTIFGLGNLKAHPNHYNVIGKQMDARLQELGATRRYEMGLGDDGECIEDDFDVWLEQFMQTLTGRETESAEETEIETPAETDRVETSQVTMSTKYPKLILEPATTDLPQDDLFHLQTTTNPFYQSDVQKLSIADNRLLGVGSAEYGLRELVLNLPDDTTYYEAGDHFVMYPKNAHCLVEAYVKLVGVDPYAVIKEPVDVGGKRPYPHPTGLTLFDTLLHCVDLGAVPSPAFSRELLGRKDVDYKNDIASPRRTVLDLALESGQPVSLEDVLYNLTPMQPRYYSIASSPLVHPTQVYLTYRPVKYVSSVGAIREGTCTTYMSNLATSSEIVGAVRSNPSFRLPQDPSAPVLLMAGGCGIAAIHAFLEERLAQAECMQQTSFGESVLYLGFRSPSDEVYRDLVDEAVERGVLTNVQVSYTAGCVRPDQHCRLVSETVRGNGKHVWNLFESGGYTYLCGGARTFGAAIEREVIAIIQEQGKMNEEEAVAYLRQLIKEGRFCEDLAD